MKREAAVLSDRRKHRGRSWLLLCCGHIDGVIKRMLFLGFGIQILLGLAWTGRNFFRVQDFAWRNLQRSEPEGLIYGAYSILGHWPPVLYLIQLGLAFYTGYRFLRRNVAEGFSMDVPRRRAFSVWGSLALLTFPFALQCHLSILPYSIVGSLFLLMLSFLLEAAVPPGAQERMRQGRRGSSPGAVPGTQERMQQGWRGSSPGAVPEGRERMRQGRRGSSPGAVPGTQERMRQGRRRGFLRALALAAACGALTVALALEAGADERDAIWGRGPKAAIASRMAWPSLWNDRIYWPDELRNLMSDEELWEATSRSSEMELILELLETRAGKEEAGKWYLQLAETAWQNRRPVILRQLGWDFLGYTVTPLILPLQLEGRSYDSYSGRNYAAMREYAPLLTERYVKYSCWWFGCVLALAAVSSGVRLLEGRADLRRALAAGGICAFVGGGWAFLYTMRAAGMMDYRCTFAVCQLWLIWGLLGMASGGKTAAVREAPHRDGESGAESLG